MAADGFRARGLGRAFGADWRNTIAASEWLELAVEATPPHARQLLRLHARADHHHVLITVSDHGSWRTPPPHPGYRGRGLTMMRSLTTELQLHPTPESATVQPRANLALLSSLSAAHSLD